MSYYIGVMSGTSLDGIDVAIASFSELTPQFKFVCAKTFPFPNDLYQSIKSIIAEQKSSLKQLGEIDIAIGQLIGRSINTLLEEQQIAATDIIAIGSHGQTIYHSPLDEYPFSQQIGNASVIAEMTGITTIADFRQRDIAAGGQGAPLVPAFHHALFNSDDEGRVIVNIGGISNITYLPQSAEQPVLGFDTGPGNVLLDSWIQLHLNQSYDSNGDWARSGNCDQGLLAGLLNEEFFNQNIPKSTGRELFNANWLNDKLFKCGKDISAVDVQASLIELTASTIANDINKYAPDSSRVFICGGGAHNNFLIERLQNKLDSKAVLTTQALGLEPDWVEACAFAWLAHRTTTNQAGNLPSVTGANKPVILGAKHSA